MHDKKSNELNQHGLHIRNVIFDRNIAKVRRIYISSFPKNERMPFPMMVLMSLLWNTRFYSFYDEDRLCGLMYLASMGKMTFVMFFAVDEKLRSQGYGSRIITALREKKPTHKIILSIEPCGEDTPNRQERAKRKSFYLHNGFRETGYMTKIAGQTQEILIQNGEFSPKGFRTFFILYSNLTMYPRVWRIADNESSGENNRRNT